MFQNMFLKSINYGAIKYMKESHFPETLKRQRQCIDKVVNSPGHISPCLYHWVFGLIYTSNVITDPLTSF